MIIQLNTEGLAYDTEKPFREQPDEVQDLVAEVMQGQPEASLSVIENCGKFNFPNADGEYEDCLRFPITTWLTEGFKVVKEIYYTSAPEAPDCFSNTGETLTVTGL